MNKVCEENNVFLGGGMFVEEQIQIQRIHV